jgi:hypothetical protein
MTAFLLTLILAVWWWWVSAATRGTHQHRNVPRIYSTQAHASYLPTYIPTCIPTHIPYIPTYETVPCLSVRCPPTLCTPLTCQTDMHIHAHIYHPHTPLLILFSCILHPSLPVSHSLSRLPFFSVSKSLPGSMGLLPPPLTHTHRNRHYFAI